MWANYQINEVIAGVWVLVGISMVTAVKVGAYINLRIKGVVPSEPPICHCGHDPRALAQLIERLSREIK